MRYTVHKLRQKMRGHNLLFLVVRVRVRSSAVWSDLAPEMWLYCVCRILRYRLSYEHPLVHLSGTKDLTGHPPR